MATPHVSGALALLNNISQKEFSRNLSEAELYAQLIKRTIPLGYTKRGVGNGLLTLAIQDKLKNLFQPYTELWEHEIKNEVGILTTQRS